MRFTRGRRLVLAGNVALLAAACATNAPDAATSVNDQQVCTRETQLGTSVPVTRCRDRAQVIQDRKAAEDMADQLRRARQSPAAGAASGS